MSEDLVTIASFATTADAAPAQTTLEANGIRAYAQGGAAADMLSYYGTAIGGVKLQVATDDVRRALECLGLTESDEDDDPAEPWDCGQCNARVDAGFKICWSCGSWFDGTSEEAAATDAVIPDPQPLTARCPMCGERISEETPECSACGESLHVAHARQQSADAAENEIDWPTPEHSEPADEVPEHIRELEEKLSSAFRAAIIGIVFCPPLLNVYSAVQLTEYSRLRQEYEAEHDWRETVDLIVNVVVILVIASILIVLLSGT